MLTNAPWSVLRSQKAVIACPQPVRVKSLSATVTEPGMGGALNSLNLQSAGSVDGVTVTTQDCLTGPMVSVMVQVPGGFAATMAVCSPMCRTSATVGSVLVQMTCLSNVLSGAKVALRVARVWAARRKAVWSRVRLATATSGRHWIN